MLYLGYKNAEGKTLEGTIVNYMFKEFIGGDVRKVGGTKAMQYWGSGIDTLLVTTACRPISGLLTLENTTCGTWANFFNDMIRLQGISGSAISVVEYTLPTGYNATLTQDINDFRLGAPEIIDIGSFNNGTFRSRPEFYVKDWNTTATDKFVWAELDENFVHLQTAHPTETFSNGKIMRWAEEQGAKAQGNADPRSSFGNHALVKWKSKYFDPSYGNLTAQFPKAWEHKSLSYFGRNLLIKYKDSSGMDIERTVNWVDKIEKQADLETTITP